MSKHYTNYNKYNNSNKPKDVVENTEPSVTPEAPVEPEVTVMSPVETPAPAVADPVEPEATVVTPEETTAPTVTVNNPEPTPPAVIGIVSNCKKLNVRTEPDITADVACIIDAGDKVEIASEGETSDFYCVYYGDTIGFCMKKYITVEQ